MFYIPIAGIIAFVLVVVIILHQKSKHVKQEALNDNTSNDLDLNSETYSEYITNSGITIFAIVAISISLMLIGDGCHDNYELKMKQQENFGKKKELKKNIESEIKREFTDSILKKIELIK